MRYTCIKKDYFNPRSPHGERPFPLSRFAPPYHFNPRSPHGERRFVRLVLPVLPCISIHAPRTGSDLVKLCKLRQCAYFNPRSPHGERQRWCKKCDKSITFQSTLPARGATTRDLITADSDEISIHAPRTGSDVRETPRTCDAGAISIHAPRTGSDVDVADVPN